MQRRILIYSGRADPRRPPVRWPSPVRCCAASPGRPACWRRAARRPSPTRRTGSPSSSCLRSRCRRAEPVRPAARRRRGPGCACSPTSRCPSCPTSSWSTATRWARWASWRRRSPRCRRWRRRRARGWRSTTSTSSASATSPGSLRALQRTAGRYGALLVFAEADGCEPFVSTALLAGRVPRVGYAGWGAWAPAAAPMDRPHAAGPPGSSSRRPHLGPRLAPRGSGLRGRGVASRPRGRGARPPRARPRPGPRAFAARARRARARGTGGRAREHILRARALERRGRARVLDRATGWGATELMRMAAVAGGDPAAAARARRHGRARRSAAPRRRLTRTDDRPARDQGKAQGALLMRCERAPATVPAAQRRGSTDGPAIRTT